MKVVKKIDETDLKAEEELKILKNLQHKNIVRYFDHFEVPDSGGESRICIIMEYCSVIFIFPN